MKKSRIATDPLVNFSITETARYTDKRSQLSDLINNTYMLIQRSCFSSPPKPMLGLSEVH